MFPLVRSILSSDNSDEPRMNEDLYRTLLNAIGDAVFIYPLAADATPGCFVEVNAAACHRLGYRREELLRLTVFDIATLPREEIQKVLVELVRQGEITRETTHRTKLGEAIPVEVCARRVELDGVAHVITTARDIRERLLSARALRESEERMRFILEAARVGSWDWNIETGEVTWSTNLETLHGRTPGSFGRSVDAILNEVYPPDRQRVEECIQAALKRGGNYEVEYRILRADGSLGWLHGQGQAVLDASGQPIRMAGVCIDVTERRRADEVTRLMAKAGAILDESLDIQGTLQAIAELLVPGFGDWCAIDVVGQDGHLERVAIVHTDPDQVEQMRAMFRRFPPGKDSPVGVAKVIRTGRAELLSSVDDTVLQTVAHNRDHLQTLRGLGVKSAIIAPLSARGHTLGAIILVSAESNRRYNRRDLEVVEQLASRCALAMDNARLYGEAWRELVERRQAEEALRQQTQTLAAINRINMVLAGQLDLEKLVQTVTDAGTELIGAEFGAFFYNAGEDESNLLTLYTLSGLSREHFAGVPMPQRTELFAPTLDGTGIVRCDDVTQDPRYGKSPPFFGTPPGHPAVRSYLAAPVVSRTGQVHGGLFFGHTQVGKFSPQDEQIIAGIAAQAAIAIDNARLYQAAQCEIAERRKVEESLREAREAAEAANRAKSEFLANMSHEIRTPMTAILGYADVLSRHLTDPDNQQCVETIRRNGQFLLEIINDILDLSRIEAGKLEIEKRRFRPDKLVAEVCSLMDIRASEKHLPLVVDYVGPLPETIESDPTRLRQILVNLLGNAIKFTETGSVTVAVRLLAEAELLRFDVIDTGVGMTEEHQSRLFQPFTQADTSVTRRYGGSGLGLAICRRLTEMLGGEISVQSVLGKGTTFTVTISTGPLDGVPLVTPSDGAHLSLDDEHESTRLDCLALVVDDRRDIRYLAQHFLEQAGARVKTAQNGREAIDMVLTAQERGEPFDVIVLDMQMPEMDGYQAAFQLRSQGVQTPIIALTAAAMQGDREKCLRAGCDDYTSKPIHGPRLVELVACYTQWVTPSELTRRRKEMLRPLTPRNVLKQARAARPSGASDVRATRRVLLVDDSADVCNLMRMVLELNGHQVEYALNGTEALQTARTFSPEVVLLDLGLPDMTGLEVVARMREFLDPRRTLLIALSGHGEPEDHSRTQAAGFHYHLVKPADPVELERLIRQGVP